MKKKGKPIVVQANKLIHAKWGKMTLVERKLYLKLVSTINKFDVEFKGTTFYLKDLVTEIGIGRNNYDDIKAASFNLLGRRLRIKEPDGELQLTLLSSAKYNDYKGTVSLCFDELLKPYLLQLKEQFTQLELDVAMKLKSVHSIRIYEIIKEIYDLGGMRIFDLEELRETLGIEKKEYQLYGHFKSRILLSTQREIAETTDLCFQFQEIKEGKRIVAIKFFVSINKGIPKTKPLFPAGHIPEIVRSRDEIKNQINTIYEKMKKLEETNEHKSDPSKYHMLVSELGSLQSQLRHHDRQVNN